MLWAEMRMGFWSEKGVTNVDMFRHASPTRRRDPVAVPTLPKSDRLCGADVAEHQPPALRLGSRALAVERRSCS